MPDSMRYFEVNGFSSPVDLEEFLNKQFNTFRLALISNTIPKKELLFKEIQDQITKTKAELFQIKQSVKPFNDITLDALVNYKLQFCDETGQIVSCYILY